VILDVLYTAWNRLEFTQRTFTYLLEHTDWSKVSRLVVYDDGSLPSARLWLQDASRDCPARVEFRAGEHRGSPVAIMVDYLASADADYFAKIDNDVALPEGWLDAMLSVIEGNPSIDLLGMEAGMTVLPFERKGSVCFPDWDGRYRLADARHIGGVGLMRNECFHRQQRLVANGRYYGFTEWQHSFMGRLSRGWVTPDLPVALLDRIPDEPFSSLSRSYVERGWQRAWGSYDENMAWAYEWVIEREEMAA
jgi:hypothetical protein